MVLASRRIVVAVGDAGAGDRGDLRSPVGGQGVVRQFHYVQQTGERFPKGLTKEIEFLVGCLRVLRAALLVRVGQVHAHIGRPGNRHRLIEFAGDDGAREAGPGPVETVFRAAGDRRGTAGAAAADHPVTGGNLYMDFRRKPVRQVADHGEPAAGIQQITDRIADRRHLQPFHRALFAAAERSLVDKGKVALAPLLMGLGKATLMVALGPRSPLS